MHRLRGFFRFAHIDGLAPADPAVYPRLPRICQEAARTLRLLLDSGVPLRTSA